MDNTNHPEFTAIAIFMFMLSSVLSFLSLRSENRKANVLKRLPTLFFYPAFFSLFLITMFVTFNIMK